MYVEVIYALRRYWTSCCSVPFIGSWKRGMYVDVKSHIELLFI